MNKRGIWKEFEIMQMVFYAFMVILVSLIIAIGFGFSLNRDTDINPLEKGISEFRLFSSKDCLGYLDDDFLVKGIIDVDKVNKDNLNKCLYYPDGKIQGLKITLKDFEGAEIKEVELNEKLSSQRLTCGYNDKYICYLDRKYVLYRDTNGLNKGILDIVVVSENV